MGLRLGKLCGLCARVTGKTKLGNMNMRSLPRNLTTAQKTELAAKLNTIAEMAKRSDGLGHVSSNDVLYTRIADLTRTIVEPSPNALLFFRKIAGSLQLDKTFFESVLPESLALSKESSPLNFSVNKNLIVHIPDESRGKIIICDPERLSADPDNSYSALSVDESGLKISRDLRAQFGSIAVTPLFLIGADSVFGAIFMGWKEANPIDPMIYLEIFGTMAHQITKKMPGKLKAV